MRYYINPEGTSKEEWLQENATLLALDVPTTHHAAGHVAVCLMDNGWMTAAGICFSSSELAAFARPDGRPKMWFAGKVDLLRPFLHGRKVEGLDDD